VKFALYFHILVVIVLGELAEHFTEERTEEDPQAFGVDHIEEEPPEQDEENSEEEVTTEDAFL
jgi:hypothetical protein